MKKEMLINVMQPEECRIAILEDGVLEELYVERTSHESYVGNIYKGRIVNIEPSIQAAFVDFGVGRNGFLHVSDVEPAYYRHLEQRRSDGGRDRDRGDRDRGRGRDRSRSGPPRPVEPVQSEMPDVEDELRALTEATDAAMTSATPETTEETAEAEPEKRRRGGRGGRSRRGGRRGDSRGERGRDRGRRGSAPESEASHPPEENVGAVERPEPEPRDEPPEPTQFMESAERYTEEGDGPSEPLESSTSISDDELFFPRSTPETAAAPPPAPPQRTEPSSRSEEPADSFDPDAYAPVDDEPAYVPRETQTAVAESDDEEPPIEDDDDLEERISNYMDEREPRPRRRNDRNDRNDRGRPRRRVFGRPGAGRPKPLIQDIFKRGQEVLVQVIKEGIGTKGPTLSTYISIAGRYLVLMPGLNRVGVSRKIADDEQRRRLREIFHELQPPKGLGFIIRTAGIDKNKKELQNDLAYLSRLWQVVVRRIRKVKAPAEIYQESDMITRTIRDTFTSDIDTIWVDEPAAYEHAKEFLQIVMPRYANRIKLYEGPEPIFHKYGIEDEISRIQMRHVPLPNGGSIVIDQTEALVAIDVNSGNFRADNNAEETAYQMNLLAAKEIARQLRLRDLGGVIVNDFIDMRDEKHRRGVEKAMRDAVKRDRARTKILKISAFGLIEMTRQRIRPSLKRSVYQECPYCRNTGQVKTCESMSIEVMRLLQLAAHRENVHRIEIRVTEDVANYLQNKKRKEISRLEEAGEIQVIVAGQTGVSPEMLEFVCYDNNNNEVKFMPYDENKPSRRR